MPELSNSFPWLCLHTAQSCGCRPGKNKMTYPGRTDHEPFGLLGYETWKMLRLSSSPFGGFSGSRRLVPGRLRLADVFAAEATGPIAARVEGYRLDIAESLT